MSKRSGAVSVMLLAVALIAAACGDDTPKAGPMTIEAEIDFSGRIGGTFEVTEGADILGCSSGTFVDSPIEVEVNRRWDFTCETGTKEGTFAAVFNLDRLPGPWSILEGTGDFSALQGEGDISMVGPDNSAKGTGTLTGDIEYTP